MRYAPPWLDFLCHFLSVVMFVFFVVYLYHIIYNREINKGPRKTKNRFYTSVI